MREEDAKGVLPITVGTGVVVCMHVLDVYQKGIPFINVVIGTM